MKVRTWKTVAVICLAISLFTLLLFLLVSNASDIQQVPLETALSDGSKTLNYEITGDNLRQKKYDLILRLNKGEDANYFEFKDGKVKSTIPFQLTVLLQANSVTIYADRISDRENKIHYGFAKNYVDMQLMSFEPKRDAKYSLQISVDGMYDLLRKYQSWILYLEEDHDRAAMPLLKTLRLLSLITLVVTALLSMVSFLKLKTADRSS